MDESNHLDAQLRALGSTAPKTLAGAPPPRDDLRLRLRHVVDLVREAGDINDHVVLITRVAGEKPLVTPFRDKLTFGRNSACGLHVAADAELSRAHFQIVSEQENYFVEDLNSRNGTYVNDYNARITRRELRNGDLILAGSQILLFWRREPEVG